MMCPRCGHNPCRCDRNEVIMVGIMLYTKKALHVGYPYMLGRIIKTDFFPEFYVVTVRYEERDICDKVFKVFKVQEVG
jgi:hypothetical protein